MTQEHKKDLHQKDTVYTAHMHKHMTASSVSFYQLKSQNVCRSKHEAAKQCCRSPDRYIYLVNAALMYVW